MAIWYDDQVCPNNKAAKVEFGLANQRQNFKVERQSKFKKAKLRNSPTILFIF
jgi:hypothetical protein